MDLIVWRHAEAQELDPGVPEAEAYHRDLERALTGRGQKHAARMAAWLDQQLTDTARILVSPALRCQQTAMNLGRKFKTSDQLAPGGSVEALLEAAHWPTGRSTVLVVGHQPTLGQAVAQLLGLPQSELSIRKGALWWLRRRERDGRSQTVLMTVQSPDFL